MSFFTPPPQGFHEAERNPDGTLKGRIDPADTKRREERRKGAMDSYFAKER